MGDLIAFLRARLDEDERWAQESASPLYSDGEPGAPGHSRRMLREVEAKRRIVGLHDGVHECPGASGHMGTYDPSLQVDNYGGPCPTLIAFAAVYDGHPDYREDWRL